MVTCGFCGSRFDEDRAQPTCQSCPLTRACKAVRCPQCGYENPAEPGWVTSLKGLVGRLGGR